MQERGMQRSTVQFEDKIGVIGTDATDCGVRWRGSESAGRHRETTNAPAQKMRNLDCSVLYHQPCRNIKLGLGT